MFLEIGAPVFAMSTVAVRAGPWDRAAVGGKQKLRRSNCCRRRIRFHGTIIDCTRIA
jgi:hypothetical protein